MGESAKALLGGLIFLSAIGVFTVWFAANIPPTPIVWELRLGLPIIVVAAAVALIRANLRKDLAPDFVRGFFGRPFERDGVCFSIRPVTRNKVAYLHIFFQNQYASACKFRVLVLPPLKSFSLGKRQFGGVALDIECEGGSFGIARGPLGIPADFQGRKVRLEVAAATDYPNGRGNLLRFRNGLRVGRADASGLGSAALTIAALAGGRVVAKRPASATFMLPGGVAENLPPAEKPAVEILWKPGDPEGNVADRVRQAVAC